MSKEGSKLCAWCALGFFAPVTAVQPRRSWPKLSTLSKVNTTPSAAGRRMTGSAATPPVDLRWRRYHPDPTASPGGAFVGETFRQPLHHQRDQVVRLLHRPTRLVHKAGLDGTPAGAEFDDRTFGEQWRCTPHRPHRHWLRRSLPGRAPRVSSLINPLCASALPPPAQ